MPAAVCEKCHGSGWVVRERDGLSGAERCDCLQAGRAENLVERAKIPPAYRNASFDSFLLPRDNPVVRDPLSRVMTVAKSYAREFPTGVPKPGLIFFGNPGTGKTHLAVAVVRELMAKGHECLFFDYQELLGRIRASYDEVSGTSDRNVYRSVLDVEVLLIDDLGNMRAMEWAEDIIASVINHRCVHRKAIIATTNLEDPEMEGTRALPSGASPSEDAEREKRFSRQRLELRIGSRARSRLAEMCTVLRMPIRDYRIEHIIRKA